MPDASPDLTSDTPPKKRRFRLRYSLQSLLLFMLLLSAALALRDGWSPWRIDHVLRGHEDAVLSAGFSPDGRRIVTASVDFTARVWDGETGRELHVLRGHEDVVNSATFSPDGRRIVTASDDGTARVWDVETGHELHVLKGHTCNIVSAAFSPDGRRIVTASHRSARVWDTETGRELHVLSGHEISVVSATFSPDGRCIVTGSWIDAARVWNGDTGHELCVLKDSDVRQYKLGRFLARRLPHRHYESSRQGPRLAARPSRMVVGRLLASAVLGRRAAGAGISLEPAARLSVAYVSWQLSSCRCAARTFFSFAGQVIGYG